jgi:hypothetical protein
MVKPLPHGFQAENHLIDPRCYWTLERRATQDELRAAVDQLEGPLWLNGSSTGHGLNDQVPASEAAKFQHSLHLINVTDLALQVAWEGVGFPNPRRKVRGRFSLNGNRYKLAVTDQDILDTYLSGKDGNFSVGDATLCISLGEAYRGYAYKLIASVIQPEPPKSDKKA